MAKQRLNARAEHGNPVVFIEVRGGVVQEVYSDSGVRVRLIDWDTQEPAPFTGEYNLVPLDRMDDDTARAFGLRRAQK